MEVINVKNSYSSLIKQSKVFQVDFVNVQDTYPYDTDLVCEFNCNNYVTQEGDRIAIFKLGWLYVRDYIVFEWAPVTANTNTFVTFNRSSLPRITDELYQFCYITNKNEVRGVSITFQFCINIDTLQSINGKDKCSIIDFKTDSKSNALSKDNTTMICSNKQCERLREENYILKETLKALILNSKCDDDSSKEVKDLKVVTQNLKDLLQLHQNEIDVLKEAVFKKQANSCEENSSFDLKCDKCEIKISKAKGVVLKVNEEDDSDFDIGELKSIPPFPFAK